MITPQLVVIDIFKRHCVLFLIRDISVPSSATTSRETEAEMDTRCPDPWNVVHLGISCHNITASLQISEVERHGVKTKYRQNPSYGRRRNRESCASKTDRIGIITSDTGDADKEDHYICIRRRGSYGNGGGY